MNRFLCTLLLTLLLVRDSTCLPLWKSQFFASVFKESQTELFPVLGGAAPYFTYPMTYGISVEVPNQCALEHVQMLARHGERYPTRKVGNKLEELWEKLKAFQGSFEGELSIFNDYQFFVHDSKYYDQLTNSTNTATETPYLGAQTARDLGRYIARTYEELINGTIPVFTSNSGRVYETAKNAIYGMKDILTLDADLQIISEDASSGVNTLTPKNSCPNYKKSDKEEALRSIDSSYLTNIKERLLQNNSQFNLTFDEEDVKTLFTWCAFEINVRGYSPVCNLFETNEFVAFSYFTDVENFYTVGLGNRLVKPIGSVLLNSSYALLKQSNDLSNKLWLSFVHDTDIENFMAALGLFDDGSTDIPTDQVAFQSVIQRGSWITPMGARLFTEKLNCGNASFVRYVLNDAVIPIPGCTRGPGFSCPFEDYQTYIEKRLDGLDFYKSCGVCKVSNTTELSFYWDYESVNYQDTPLDYKLL